MILNTTDSLRQITNTLDSGFNVYFTRFGDNDVMQMSGTDLRNRTLAGKSLGGNRTKFSKALQQELLESFTINDDLYLIGLSGEYEKEPGMDKGLFEPFGYNKQLDIKVKMITKRTSFLNPVLFHYLYCFEYKKFQDFVTKYIKGYDILYIGSIEKEIAELELGSIKYYVRTPSKNCYEKIDKWYPKALEYARKAQIIIPSCGQATRVIQKRFWNEDINATSIDMGSIFDAMAGLRTRTWIKLVGDGIKKRYAKEED